MIAANVSESQVLQSIGRTITGRMAPTVNGTVTSGDSYKCRPTSVRTGPRRIARPIMADARRQPYHSRATNRRTPATYTMSNTSGSHEREARAPVSDAGSRSLNRAESCTKGDGIGLMALRACVECPTTAGDGSSVAGAASKKTPAAAGTGTGSAGTTDGSTGISSIANSTALHAE